jgi:hypothetical protein
LRTTLQFYKASTPIEVDEREKMGGRKIIAGAHPCHGCRHAPPHHFEGGVLLWTPPRKAIDDHWEVPHALIIFFYYQKIRIPLIPWDNCKKTDVKRLKVPLDFRQKKIVNSRGYTVIALYKKYKNPKIPFKH